MNRQYFYLVCESYDEATYPRKIFLQESEAIRYGKRLATQARKAGFNSDFYLYMQEITRNGRLHLVCHLEPYKEVMKNAEGFDWNEID